MFGIDFNKEREQHELEIDKHYKENSLMGKIFSKYLCPKCNAHLKECDNGDIICLNSCHLSESSRKRLQKSISLLSEQFNEKVK